MDTLKRAMKAGCAFAIAVFTVFTSGAAPASMVYAEDLTAYDQTSIESDLNGVDVSKYGKDESGTHCLIPEFGFVEYAYSSSSFISSNYYGVYFYVYNPTEREVSDRPGANVVNMAVAYDADGEPSEYENCTLTLLDHTENHRFYKFKLSNSKGAYERARAYASAHDGVRRYDVAGIQLWFKGEMTASDGVADGVTDKGSTFLCTGFAAGCGADPDASSLKIEYKNFETIRLDVHDTYYRTGYDTSAEGNQTTLWSVYFSVPEHYVRDYGNLQIVRARWDEFKVSPVLVTDDDEAAGWISQYLGYELPNLTQHGNAYYDDDVDLSIYEYLGPSDSGNQGWGFNNKKCYPGVQRIDWLISTKDISKEVSSTVLREYCYGYAGNPNDEKLVIGEKRLNANLFSDTVDEGHVRGENVRTFDARDPEDWIDLNIENVTSAWERFLNLFRAGNQYKEYITRKDILPIERITSEKLNGSRQEISDRILISQSELGDFLEFYEAETKLGNYVYDFRFSTTEYDAFEVEITDNSTFGSYYSKTGYVFTDTLFFNFEVIYLGFVKDDEVTIVPTVMSPIDIFPRATPPESILNDDFWTFVWIMCGVIGVLVVGIIVTSLISKASKKE